MAGAIAVFNLGIIARALVRVFNQQRNWRTRRLAFKHARENFHGVRFFALGHETRRAGFALIQIGLNIGLGQGNTRRATVNDAANGRPVALPPGRKAK